MAVTLSSLAGAGAQFFDNNGVPLAGGLIYTYLAGTSTPAATYTSSTGLIAHANPIVLDAAGRIAAGEVWLTSGVEYKFIVQTSLFVQLGSYDNIPSINDFTSIYAALANTTNVALGDALIGFKQSNSVGVLGGTVGRTVHQKLQESVSVKDFGAVGDGVTNDTAAIQAALNSGAKNINGVAGETYLITDTLSITATKITFDLKRCELKLNDATGLKSHIIIGSGATQTGGVWIQNTIFTRVQVATGGYAIDTNFVGNLQITDCIVFGDNKIYNGIRLYKAILCTIQNSEVYSCVNTGIYLEGAGTGADSTIDINIRENRVESCATNLVTWDYVEGLYCRDNIFFNASSTCVSLNASTNAKGLVSFKLQENDFDTAPTGLYVQNISNIQITDNWFSNISNKCLFVDDNVDGGVIADNQIITAVYGIDMGGDNFTITGNRIAGTGFGALIRATSNHLVVNDNSFQTNNGIDLTPNPTYVIVANNDFNNSVGAITGTGGTGCQIQSNLGDLSRGTSTNIVVGASPFTYTNGARPATVSVFSGNVTKVSIGTNDVAGVFTDGNTFTLPPNTSMVVTYTSVPIMTTILL